MRKRKDISGASPYGRPQGQKPAYKKNVDVVMGGTAYVPRPLSGTTQQAMRTGGWADPSRNSEVKFIDSQAGIGLSIGAVTFASAQLLNGCASGSTATTRIGRKINLKSLYIRYKFEIAATTTLGGTCRILVVYDKQANATAPAITDILFEDKHLSPNNLSNRDRFVTLVDHVTDPIGVNANASVAGVIYRKINLETMFNTGSAGTIGDITSGSVYLFAAQSGIMGVASPTLTYLARVKFTD